MLHLPNMTASIPYSSTVLTLDFLGHFHSRRLLLHIPLHQSQAAATPPAAKSSHDPAEPYAEEASLDANVVMILSILVCAVVCSLALNLIIRCVYRFTRSVASAGGGGDNHPSPKAANKGIKEEVLKTFPTLSYTDGLSRPGLGTECVVCLSEFTAGELVRVLPECNHGFHVHCIDEWLNSHSSCPTCRHCLLPTCPKAAKASQASSPEPPTQPPEHTTISIAPLEPEGLIRDHRNSQHVNEHVVKP